MGKKREAKLTKYNQFIFDAYINAETAGKLINWIDSVDIDHRNTHLIFSSAGGSVVYSHEIVRALNRKPNIILQAPSHLYSGGFHIFTECINAKIIGEYFFSGLMHWGDTEVSAKNTFSKELNLDSMMLPHIQEISERLYSSVRPFLHKREQTDYNKQKDVCFNKKRMLTIADKLNEANGWEVTKTGIDVTT